MDIEAVRTILRSIDAVRAQKAKLEDKLSELSLELSDHIPSKNQQDFDNPITFVLEDGRTATVTRPVAWTWSQELLEDALAIIDFDHPHLDMSEVVTSELKVSLSKLKKDVPAEAQRHVYNAGTFTGKNKDGTLKALKIEYKEPKT